MNVQNVERNLIKMVMSRGQNALTLGRSGVSVQNVDSDIKISLLLHIGDPNMVEKITLLHTVIILHTGAFTLLQSHTAVSVIRCQDMAII